MNKSRCHTCGKEIDAGSSGRARIYCSDKCRQRAYRERKYLHSTSFSQPMSDDRAAEIIHDLQLEVAVMRDASKRANPLYRPLFSELADGLYQLLDSRGLA